MKFSAVTILQWVEFPIIFVWIFAWRFHGPMISAHLWSWLVTAVITSMKLTVHWRRLSACESSDSHRAVYTGWAKNWAIIGYMPRKQRVNSWIDNVFVMRQNDTTWWNDKNWMYTTLQDTSHECRAIGLQQKVHFLTKVDIFTLHF